MNQTAHDLIDEASDDHPDDVLDAAREYIDHDEMWTVGKNPRGVAAAVLYAAYRSERPLADPGDGIPTQMDLADEFDTSAVTLRNRFNDLADLLGGEVA